MPIQRNPIQGSQTLEAYYQAIASSPDVVLQLVGEQMLQLLDIVNELFPQMPLWGLTSMARLWLLPDLEPENSSFVLVSSAILPDAYQIEYVLPASRRHWEHAFVRGESGSVEQTKRYLLVAMRESEGWVGNAELEAILAQHGLSVV